MSDCRYEGYRRDLKVELLLYHLGRVVVDLRALNDLVIPDVYLMPSQDDILSYIRRKKFIAVLGATASRYIYAYLPTYIPTYILTYVCT